MIPVIEQPIPEVVTAAPTLLGPGKGEQECAHLALAEKEDTKT
jgi:hypothetical protein